MVHPNDGCELVFRICKDYVAISSIFSSIYWCVLLPHSCSSFRPELNILLPDHHVLIPLHSTDSSPSHHASKPHWACRPGLPAKLNCLFLTKDPFRSVYCIHTLILISSSVCQTGLSRQPTSVSICPSCGLQSHAGRCHTLASAPDFHTNLYFYPGTYHPGALWTEYRTHQRRKIRLTSVDAWLNTLFDMSVLIRTWRTALPAFTLHRKVTAIQAVGLAALIKASLRMVAHGGRI